MTIMGESTLLTQLKINLNLLIFLKKGITVHWSRRTELLTINLCSQMLLEKKIYEAVSELITNKNYVKIVFTNAVRGQ